MSGTTPAPWVSKAQKCEPHRPKPVCPAAARHSEPWTFRRSKSHLNLIGDGHSPGRADVLEGGAQVAGRQHHLSPALASLARPSATATRVPVLRSPGSTRR
jgi:hypothetical protein